MYYINNIFLIYIYYNIIYMFRLRSFNNPPITQLALRNTNTILHECPNHSPYPYLSRKYGSSCCGKNGIVKINGRYYCKLSARINCQPNRS